jgi:uncharacterized membrane protein
MRRRRLLAISSIVLFAGCTEQTATGPGTAKLKPKGANFTTYIATPSAPVILGAWNSSSYTIAYDINDLGAISGVSDQLNNAVHWETGTAAAPASTTALLVDGPGKIGRAINAAGQIAGENVTHAGLWTPNGVGGYTLTDIGADPLFSLSLLSVAYGVNAGGKVVGNYRVQVGAVFVDKCFLWTPTSPNATTGSAVELIGLGGNFCVANDINAIGQIAGASIDLVSGFTHATVWNSGNVQGIDLQPGAQASYGASINNAGQVAGSHTVTSTNAAIWTPSGAGWSTASDLVAPAFSGQSGVITSQALDINDAGFVVGETEDAGFANIRAFFWQSGTFTELPDPGPSVSEATALTDVIGSLVLVSGGDVFDVPTNSRHGLRWSVALTPISPDGCLAQLTQLITDLRNASVLNAGEARSLLAKVDAATRQASQGKTTAAKNVLYALIAEANALRTSGRLTSAQAQQLIDAAQCAIAAL